MRSRRSVTSLVVGLVLVGLGCLLLLNNLVDLDINWILAAQFSLPTLFLVAGVFRLFQHFSRRRKVSAETVHPSALLSGLFFTSVGVVWYLGLLDVIDFIPFVGRYWPLLLVLFGIGKIADFYLFRARVPLRGMEVVGVLLVILLGLTCSWIAAADWPGLLFEHHPAHVWSSVESIEVGEVEGLEIINAHGEVRVEPGRDGFVDIKLTGSTREGDSEAMERLSKRVKVTFQQQGSHLVVGTNRQDLPAGSLHFGSDLTVSVPRQFGVSVTNEYGGVSLTGLAADCSVRNSHGDVLVEGVRGMVAVENKYGDTTLRDLDGEATVAASHGRVEVHHLRGNGLIASDFDTIVARDVSGRLEARNRFGRIEVASVRGELTVEAPGSAVRVRDVEGRVSIRNSHRPVKVEDLKDSLEIETSYSKALQVRKVAGNVRLRTSHTSLEASQLESGILMDGVSTEVGVEGVKGPFDIVTSLRPVRITGFGGEGKVQNEFADITLSSARLKEGLMVVNKSGNITLRVPPDSQFSLSAQAPGGKVTSGFSEPASNDATVLMTRVGRGGPEVRLQTTHAFIRVEKRKSR